tara:strand:+ start:727 stop:1407 length:681 start_codon:yes stop_codon:yes gene_type:complete
MGDQSKVESQLKAATEQNKKLQNYLTNGFDRENSRYFYEVLNSKNNLIGDAFTEYLMTNDDVPSLTNAYERLKQNNLTKKRQIEINNYNNKTYIDYSNILKTIILLIISMVPFIILAKFGFLNKKISLSIIIVIIFLGSLYILYRLYLLNIKDNKIYHKDKIPHNRKAYKLEQEGKFKPKVSPLKGFGITCIGEECCDVGMLYDATRNKCYKEPPKVTADPADQTQ